MPLSWSPCESGRSGAAESPDWPCCASSEAALSPPCPSDPSRWALLSMPCPAPPEPTSPYAGTGPLEDVDDEWYDVYVVDEKWLTSVPLPPPWWAASATDEPMPPSGDRMPNRLALLVRCSTADWPPASLAYCESSNSRSSGASR